jgi:hypothetical protein
MDPDIAISSFYVLFKYVLLFVVEHIARGIEENDDFILLEYLHRELSGIFRGIDTETIFHPEFLDRLNSSRDRIVAETGSFTKDQNFDLICRLGGAHEAKDQSSENITYEHKDSAGWFNNIPAMGKM